MTLAYPGALGILQLQNTPRTLPGSISSPETFPFVTICRQVPNAWVDNVVFGKDDRAMQEAFVAAAQSLVSEGAVAITTNCGFTVKYQKAMASAVAVPVAASSLLLLPYLSAVVGGRIGVLTFNSRPLTAEVLQLAGVGPDTPLAIAGIEGSPTWEVMSTSANNYTVEQMTEDVLARVEAMRRQHPDIRALLFECAGFPPTAAAIRRATQLPVYDAVTNAHALMNGLRLSCPSGGASSLH